MSNCIYKLDKVNKTFNNEFELNDYLIKNKLNNYAANSYVFELSSKAQEISNKISNLQHKGLDNKTLMGVYDFLDQEHITENKDELGVNKEIYYFFDGNENHINLFKNDNIKLEEYSKNIKTMENALENIINMKKYLNEEINVENELDLIVKYNSSINFICKKIKTIKLEDIYILINELEKEYKQEREKLIDFLSKIIINSRMIVDLENLKKLINIKNSIRSNVNIRSVLFNFFEYLKS